MAGIRRVSDLGTNGVANIADGAVSTADIASNAVTQVKMDTTTPLSGMRNFIINGNMSVYQRGSFSGSSGYGLDRWHINSGANVTLSQSASAPSPSSLYSMLMIATGTQQIFARQAIETKNAVNLAGKTVTLSAYAQGYGGATTNLNMSLAYSNSTDNSVSGTWIDITPVSGGNLTLSNTLTRFSATFVVPNVNPLSLRVQFVNNAANFTNGQGYYLSDVQLEVGTQATAFEQRPYGLELMLCQRYYYINISTLYLSMPLIAVGADNVNYTTYNWPVPMRAAPNVALAGVAAEGHHTSTPSIHHTNPHMVGFEYNGATERTPGIRLSIGTLTAEKEL